MTELGSDEVPNTLADRINTALVAFTGCIGESLDEICSYSLTFGEAYVPFKPDEDDECEEDYECNQAWVRVTGIEVRFADKGFDSTPGGDTGKCEGACGGDFEIGLEVGVLRCYHVPEKGEAPDATDVMAMALQQMEDMAALFGAAMNCEVWESIDPGQWNPEGPLGGQYGGYWNFSVQL